MDWEWHAVTDRMAAQTEAKRQDLLARLRAGDDSLAHESADALERAWKANKLMAAELERLRKLVRPDYVHRPVRRAH